MKAAIYNPYLDTLGGGERYSLSFAKVLLDQGYDVDLYWKDDSIVKKLISRFDLNLSGLKVVDDIKKGEGYDVCFWVSDGSIPLLHSRKNILHFQIPFTVADGRSLMNKMKFFRINHVVCNSHFTKNIIDKTYRIDSEVIYPPVDVEKIKPGVKKSIILAIGRFSQLKQSKRQDVLIKAFQKFHKKNTQWKLILAGGVEVGVGNYLKKLKQKAGGLPVEFIESPDNKTLLKLYAQSKIFWTASGYEIDEKKEPERVEHFGITTVEAMAAGCVPLAFAAGGSKEIIVNEENGFLWNNTNELVGKTIALINDKEKYQKIADAGVSRSKSFSFAEFEKRVVSIL